MRVRVDYVSVLRVCYVCVGPRACVCYVSMWLPFLLRLRDKGAGPHVSASAVYLTLPNRSRPPLRWRRSIGRTQRQGGSGVLVKVDT